jgi:hypothetical protein
MINLCIKRKSFTQKQIMQTLIHKRTHMASVNASTDQICSKSIITFDDHRVIFDRTHLSPNKSKYYCRYENFPPTGHC